ncbi:MAG: peptidoglycan DD-metalloendopeptidase family protein [Gaiellaceae bacterium]
MTHYFVNPNVSRDDAKDGIGRYWRKTESYSGWGQPGDTYGAVAGTSTNARFRFQVNLSLLASLLGDAATLVPHALKLVTPIDYGARHREDILSAGEETTISLQPREAIASWGLMELPIGPLLAAFLDDPLELGRSLDLGLPFLNPQASVSKTWIRSGTNAFHGGFDSSVPAESGEDKPRFDVCAAADGVVWMLINDSDDGHQGGVVLLHEPAAGKRYATLYQHLQPASVRLAVGDGVERGQRIGRVRPWGARTHSHINVLVQGPDESLGSTLAPDCGLPSTRSASTTTT